MEYVDMHNHLLWGVDDGAKTEGEALRHLRSLKRQGVGLVVLTPHMCSPFVPHGCADVKTIRRRFEELEATCEKDQEKYPYLRLGSEYYYDVRRDEGYDRRLGFRDDKPASNFHPIPLGYSNWVLLELPNDLKPLEVVDSVRKVNAAGFQVLLAHAEKVTAFAKEFGEWSWMKDSVSFDVKVQTEAWDIAQGYPEATAFVASRFTDVIGTDTHGDHRPPVFDKAVEKLKETVQDEKYLKNILYRKASLILE